MDLKVHVKRASVTLLMCMLCVVAFAQKTVTGTVKDAAGEPMIGVNVLIKGTSIGAMTNLDGQFTIPNAPAGATLEVSFIGYKTQNIKIGTSSTINVVMSEDAENLDEVVVIGYGAVKKRDLTGSVASVTGKDLINNPVTDVTQALQGHLPGVSVLTQDGRPDATVSIKVRGGGSITQSNEPIFIVDGFPVSSISDIPADQIESIDVLKDASSTAIYGARGANGVILVTTKSAKEEKTNVTYSGYLQFQKVAKVLPVWDNAQEYAAYNWAYSTLVNGNEDLATTYFGLGTDPKAKENWNAYANMKMHNYTEDMLRDVVTQNHNLTVSSGSKSTKLMFGLNYSGGDAIRINSGYQRWNASLKVQQDINKKMKLGVDLRFTQFGYNGNMGMGEMARAYRYRPLDETMGDNSNYAGFGNGDGNVDLNKNVLKKVENSEQERLNRRFRGALTFSWDILKGLKLNEELGMGFNWSRNEEWVGNYDTSNNSAEYTLTDSYNIRNAITLNYQLPLGKNHDASILAGQEVMMSHEDETSLSGEGYPESFGFDEAMGMINVTDGTHDEWNRTIKMPSRTLSFFGRANYSYKGRYLFTATFRADGSTKFAPNNRWGYFPAAAVAWRLSDEAFMKKYSNWLDNLKLRFSYGEAGADNISSNLWKDTWSAGTANVSGKTVVTFKPGDTLPNPNLKWETTISRNLAFDFGFFNRFFGSLEFYYNSNKNLLIRIPVDVTTGYKYQYRNAGETSNKGVDFNLTAHIVKSKDFNLSASFNYNYNRNAIEKLAEGVDTEYGNGIFGSTMKQPHDEYRLIIGRPVGTLVGYHVTGFYTPDDFNYDPTSKVYTLKQGVADFPLALNTYYGESKFNRASGQKAFPGSLKVETDANGAAVLREFDMSPKHIGGLTLNANYKNFDFNANFAWQLGGHIYNAQAMDDFVGSKDNTFGANHYAYFGETYKIWEVKDGVLNWVTDPEGLNALNKNAKYALPTFEYAAIFDNWIEDASYLRLNSLTIGYTLPKNLVKKAGIQNLRFYLTGGNLFVLSGYSGLDPEVNTKPSTDSFPTPGVDMSAFPRPRTFTFGASITF